LMVVLKRWDFLQLILPLSSPFNSELRDPKGAADGSAAGDVVQDVGAAGASCRYRQQQPPPHPPPQPFTADMQRLLERSVPSASFAAVVDGCSKWTTLAQRCALVSCALNNAWLGVQRLLPDVCCKTAITPPSPPPEPSAALQRTAVP
jgi:hypothetical protein